MLFLAPSGTIARASGCSLSASAAAAIAEQLAIGHAGSDETGHCMPACGQRPGLVEEHGVDRAHAFERQPVLHEDAGARRDARRHRDGQRDRQSQRMRAGDDEHRHRALDRLIDLAEKRSTP